METTELGRTGLRITRLGAGLAEIGEPHTDDPVGRASQVLGAALDAGINFLDTAACYGLSEELIGKTVADRRDQYVLATKCGHAAGDWQGEAWTRETLEHSIDRSLRLMKTDRVDVLQLHSCSVEILERGDVIEVLQRARDAGKARFLGYSGDNAAARWAVDSGHFDTLQTSFNLVDQHARTTGLLKAAKAKGMGVIVKRPIANGAWGASEAPSTYSAEYFRRAEAMRADGRVAGAPDDRILLAMAFTFAHPEVDTAIIGTQNTAHMLSNVETIVRRPHIDARALEDLHGRFDARGKGWKQQV